MKVDAELCVAEPAPPKENPIAAEEPGPKLGFVLPKADAFAAEEFAPPIRIIQQQC